MSLGPIRATPARVSFLPFGRTLLRERVLALFRLLTALTCWGCLPLIRPLAGDHGRALFVVIFGYTLSCLLIVARVSMPRVLRTPLMILIHASDVIWPSVMCLVTGCLASPFLLLFIFALLAASQRRTVPKAMIFPLFGILIVQCESLVGTLPSFSFLHLVSGPPQIGSFVVTASILLISGAFLAYSDRWTKREQEAYAVQSILQCLRSNASVQANLKVILPELVEIFEAKRAVLVLRNSATGRVFHWTVGDAIEGPIYQAVPASEEGRYFWPMPMKCWSIACSGSGNKFDLVGLDREGSRTRPKSEAFRAGPGWDQPFQTLLTTTLQFGSEWVGRVFLIDPPCAGGRELCLRLLHRLGDEVGSALYSSYLWQHTSIRVRGIERRRLARDLHDGVVQSLIATELRLDLLRRQNLKGQPIANISEILLSAQNVLQSEVRKLREQIDQLRSSELPQQARTRLTDLLQNFERESGIVTRFVCDVEEDAIPRKVCGDLIRIVEEALSNVMRHSGASKVEVRLTSRDDGWEVMINDDGRGFDFAGRLSLAQLEAVRKGPRAIRERVHSVNGDLILESYPDRGASLKIRLASNF